MLIVAFLVFSTTSATIYSCTRAITRSQDQRRTIARRLVRTTQFIDRADQAMRRRRSTYPMPPSPPVVG